MEKDFISFELAVKLKEKGFDEECYTFYEYNSKEFYREERIPCCNSRSDDYAAPIIDQVLKWLRKEKKIYVLVEVEYEDWFEYKIVQTIKGIRGTNTRVYETYDEAILAGIEYVINNLI